MNPMHNATLLCLVVLTAVPAATAQEVGVTIDPTDHTNNCGVYPITATQTDAGFNPDTVAVWFTFASDDLLGVEELLLLPAYGPELRTGYMVQPTCTVYDILDMGFAQA